VTLETVTSEEIASALLFGASAARAEQFCNDEPTSIPGIFYHGAPSVSITTFRSQLELKKGPALRSGIYFTQSPTYAVMYAAARGNGFCGRIYRVALVTSRTLRPSNWIVPVGGAQASDEDDREERMVSEAAGTGYDSIVSIPGIEGDGVPLEVIVLDPAVIRYLDRPVAVRPFAKPWQFSTVPFYQASGVPHPEYAPGSVPFFSNRLRASAHGADIQTVAVLAHGPLYCNRTTWPLFDFGLLRHWNVEALVDPETGDGLLIVPDKIRLRDRNTVRLFRKSMTRRAGTEEW
jgi:hypothetical protein